MTEQDERRRATQEVSSRLGRKGVWLSGRETSEELVELLEAVERFEAAAERHGADLMVDEPVPGSRAPIAPDNAAFVLPSREKSESVAHFVDRLVEATRRT